MPLSRRQFLSLSGLTAAVALLAACSPAEVARRAVIGRPALEEWPVAGDTAWRALNRLTFGPRANERVQAADIGVPAWIEEQLAPETIDDTVAEWRVRGLNTLTMDNSLIFSVREDTVTRELAQAALLRAVYCKRQLYELMVDFWSDHFSISTQKADCAWLKPIDDRTVIRKHALGNFGDLLWASMHSPAMLKYLDNQENFRGKPNENYARELMELHTLGFGSGYTQRDVQEVARCLTGQTVDSGLHRGQFSFAPEQHDPSAKTILGHVIDAGGGEHDAERVFDLLMAQPSLPHFVARKLVRRFVADDPPVALVDAAATAFNHSRGDIKTVLRTMLLSKDFDASPARYKRPLHFVAGALRQLDAETDGGRQLLDVLARMGQPLFQWPTPDGFPDLTSAWNANPLPRWQFALQLVTGAIPGTSVDWAGMAKASGAANMDDAVHHLAVLLTGVPLPDDTSNALLGALGHRLDGDGMQIAAAALLATQNYQWR